MTFTGRRIKFCEQGILCRYSAPYIAQNTIRGFPWGVQCFDASAPYLYQNTICENGGGVFGCSGVLSCNTISSNTGTGIADCSGQIGQNLISDNASHGLSGCSGTIFENTIAANEGAGLFACEAVIRNNQISQNTVSGLDSCRGEVFDNEIIGNGIGCSNCSGEIHHNLISGSRLHGVSGGSQQLRENVITANRGFGVSGFSGIVKNNLVAGNSSTGVDNCSAVINNTIVENKGHGVANCGGVVKNNIIAYNGVYGLSGTAANSYNCFWKNAAGNFYLGHANTGDIYADPLFVAPGRWNGYIWTAGDYTLQSEYGHWDAAGLQWVADSRTSPCIDKGDPADSIEYEPNPNGGRINMGHHGGTQWASKGSTNGPDPQDPPVLPPVCLNRPTMDATGDCKVDLADFAVFAAQWMTCGYEDPQSCW